MNQKPQIYNIYLYYYINIYIYSDKLAIATSFIFGLLASNSLGHGFILFVHIGRLITLI